MNSVAAFSPLKTHHDVVIPRWSCRAFSIERRKNQHVSDKEYYEALRELQVETEDPIELVKEQFIRLTKIYHPDAENGDT